ncbi:MAG TPA: hypothetical protein VNS50_02490 [Ginsengibacter sp.]|nr:hypothetical protein [Ginsengibacter sp.]
MNPHSMKHAHHVSIEIIINRRLYAILFLVVNVLSKKGSTHIIADKVTPE